MFGLTPGKNCVKPLWAKAAADHAIALGWSNDGKHLAAAASAGPVTVFDAASGAETLQVPGHVGGTLALGWSPAAAVLATAGKDGRVRLWDARGRETAVLAAAAPWVEHVAWRPDGSSLAAAAGRTVHVWDSVGRHFADLTGHPSTVSDLAWKPGCAVVSALVYGGVMLWTLRGDGPPTFQLFPWKGSPLRLAWSPDGKMLAHGNQDATIHFWYAETAEELQMSGYPTKVRELSWDATSRYLATGGGPAVCVWNCGGAGPAGTTPTILEGHVEAKTVSAVHFQPAGELLASGGTDGRVCVWRPRDRKRPLAGAAAGAGGAVTTLAWSPDGTLLAAGYESGAVAVLAVT